ncbi:MAG: cation transporter dimerization domain-containing protein, partial [Candidatus Hodarchaeota archaeon]
IDPRISKEHLNIHIEPFKSKRSLEPDLEDLKKKIQLLTERNELLYNPHEIKAYMMPSGVFISVHCNAQPTLSIEEVHKATAILEEDISREITGESHIYIYVEPE